MWSKRVCFGFGARHACLRGQKCEGGGVVDMRRVRVFLIVDERDRMAKNVNKAIKMWS